MTRNVMRRFLFAPAILAAWAARPARADGFVVPWFGSAFAQDRDDTGRLSAGGTLGSLGSGELLASMWIFPHRQQQRCQYDSTQTGRGAFLAPVRGVVVRQAPRGDSTT